MDYEVRISPVDRPRWSDLERFFEQRGGPHTCWCMVWRDMPSKLRGDKVAKKAALKCRVDAGMPVGILAYEGDNPVGWCSVGPKTSFRRLTDDTNNDRVWSIICFFVDRAHRATGLTGRLIDEAISYARSNDAKIVEAYPVDRGAPSYRFMGFVDRFERAGFVEVGMAGTRRHVMRLLLC